MAFVPRGRRSQNIDKHFNSSPKRYDCRKIKQTYSSLQSMSNTCVINRVDLANYLIKVLPSFPDKKL